MSRHNATHVRNGPTRRDRAGWTLLVALVVLAIGLGLGIPLAATSRPSYLADYAKLKPRYESWRTSSHGEIGCQECHSGGRASLVRGAAYRAALVGEFYLRLFRRGSPDKPSLIQLKRPSRAACLGCHEDDRSFDVKKLVRIPHPAHNQVSDEKRDCVKCHKWTTHTEKYEEKHKSIVFSGICLGFGCHSGTKKTEECSSCHHQESFKPAVWRTTHPKIVLASGSNSCLDYCHKPNECRTCHTTGKTPFTASGNGLPRAGRLIAKHAGGNWIGLHGKEAARDDSTCFYCHGSKEACNICHSKRPAFHGSKSTWLARHKGFAESEPQRCLACHLKKTCDACHKLFKETGR